MEALRLLGYDVRLRGGKNISKKIKPAGAVEPTYFRADDLANGQLHASEGIAQLLVDIVRPDPRERLFVAIAGPAASGKSTLAANLTTVLIRLGKKAKLIPLDGFHHANTRLKERGMLHEKGSPQTFDVTGFERLVQDICRMDCEVMFPTFDRPGDQVIQDGGRIDPETEIVVFEGAYLLYDDPAWHGVCHHWHRSVWLDVPEPELKHRLIRRWTDLGFSLEEAKTKALDNDILNARLAVANSLPADIVVRDR